jgi:hypothetical protein
VGLEKNELDEEKREEESMVPLSFSPFSSLGLILFGFRREKSKQQGKTFFFNTRNVIWNHKLLHILTKIRGN